jgi:hypothetical protein
MSLHNTKTRQPYSPPTVQTATHAHPSSYQPELRTDRSQARFSPHTFRRYAEARGGFLLYKCILKVAVLEDTTRRSPPLRHRWGYAQLLRVRFYRFGWQQCRHHTNRRYMATDLLVSERAGKWRKDSGLTMPSRLAPYPARPARNLISLRL